MNKQGCVFLYPGLIDASLAITSVSSPSFSAVVADT